VNESHSEISSRVPLLAFEAGERWCAFGDSITQEGWYHHLVELFHLTRFPSNPLHVLNCGIAGDTAGGALKRLRWDCLEAAPTTVSVMLGMNDVGRELFGADNPSTGELEARSARAVAYESNMRQLVNQLVASGAKVVLLTPSLFDETAELPEPRKAGCGVALAGFAQRVQDMATELGLPVVDFNGAMAKVNRKRQNLDPHFTIVGPDRVHPAAPGHFVMAYEFLRTQHGTCPVAHIEIDAGRNLAGTLRNCEISHLLTDGLGVSFTCLEGALPFPVPPAAAPALDDVPFTEDFNQETLVVRGLKPGRYVLSIDGQQIANFSDSELAVGVNLTQQENTPQNQQAMEVLQVLLAKWDTAAKLRSIAFVEHSAWPGAGHPAEPATMVAKVEEWRSKISKENHWCLSIGENYHHLVAQREEMRRHLEQEMDALTLVNTPRPRQFKIKHQSNQTSDSLRSSS